MRLIDADELIEFIENRYEITWDSGTYEGGIKDACSDMLEKIDNMETIKPETSCSEFPNSWIPCSERLPERDGEYLVTYEKGYAEDYGLDLVGIAPFEVDCEGFGIWQERFDLHTLGSLGSDWVDISVIAWRELPDPWGGEQE